MKLKYIRGELVLIILKTIRHVLRCLNGKNVIKAIINFTTEIEKSNTVKVINLRYKNFIKLSVVINIYTCYIINPAKKTRFTRCGKRMK